MHDDAETPTSGRRFNHWLGGSTHGRAFSKAMGRLNWIFEFRRIVAEYTCPTFLTPHYTLVVSCLPRQEVIQSL